MKDYDGYNFEKFKELALDTSLSQYEKIGFPDSYRENTEKYIFSDILAKCDNLKKKKNLTVLNIGPGCSNLEKIISKYCAIKKHNQIMVDSHEMLALIEDNEYKIKVPGKFPNIYENLKAEYNHFDVIICYSVLHYFYCDENFFHTIECILDLLKEGGQCILGDIPNIDKRKRFFSSNTGINFHKKFMKTTENPIVKFNCLDKGVIGEPLLFSIIHKCHASGFDAYIVPQDERLPFSNRRDDIIIRNP